MGTKTCSRCKIEKNIDQFNWRNISKGWRRPECRECQSKDRKKLIEKNKEQSILLYKKICPVCGIDKKITEYHKNAGNKDGVAFSCKECVKIQTRVRIKNKLKNGINLPDSKICSKCNIRKKQENFHLAIDSKDGLFYICKECQSKYVKEYKDRDIKHYNLIFRRARSKRKAAHGSFTKEDVYALFDLQNNTCIYSGINPFCYNNLNKYHIDHILPLSRGGTNDAHNIQILCQKCNSMKSAKTHEEFIEYIEALIKN